MKNQHLTQEMIDSIPVEQRMEIAREILDETWNRMVRDILPLGAKVVSREWISVPNPDKIRLLQSVFTPFEINGSTIKPVNCWLDEDGVTYKYVAFAPVNGLLQSIHNDLWDDVGDQAMLITWLDDFGIPRTTLMDRAGVKIGK